MPTDAATMPAAAAATEAPAASAAPEAPAATGDEDSSFGGSSGDAATEWSAAGGEMPAAGGDMPAMDFGGGFGFGSSSDVKLQYSDDNPSSYSNIFNNAKTDITEADQTRLIASLKALSQRDVSVVDTESVINYMAVHNFLCNGDSYTGMMVHNYYLYEEDGVLSMIPWDYNLGYGGFSGGTGTSVVNTSISQLVSNSTGSDRPMAYWIMASDEYMAEYYAAYQEFIDTVFASGWFEQEIDRVIAMIDPYVKEDPTAFCTYEEFLKGSETLKNFCIKRAQSVQNQLDGNNTQVDGSDLDIASMGNMDNGGGGGGFNMPSRSGDEASTEGGDVTAAEGGNTAQAAADDASAGSSGGQAATEEAPAADPAVTEEAPAADPAATGDAPDADPAATEENPDAAAAEAERTRPASRTSSTSRTSTDTWTWLIICLAALVVALIIAKCFRTNR